MGIFSRVFARPGDTTVIKVGGYSRKGGHNRDDAWPKYAKLVSTLPENKYAPKIHGYRDMGRYYIAEMERLDRTYEDRLYDLHKAGLQDAADRLTEGYDQIIQAVEGYDKILLDKIHDSDPDLYAITQGIRIQPEIKDIHARNIMVRSDDTLVITDPFY